MGTVPKDNIMKALLYNIARLIGYTIIIEDTINLQTWETTKYTHIVIYKYQGRWKSDNSIRLRRVWAFKIR
jgi:hypothetical protein